MSVLEETHLLSKDVMKESRPHLLPLPQHIQLVANTCYHLLTEVIKPQLCLCVYRDMGSLTVASFPGQQHGNEATCTERMYVCMYVCMYVRMV